MPLITAFMRMGSVFLLRSVIVGLLLCALSGLVAQDQEVFANQELPHAVDLYGSYLENNGGRSNLQSLQTFMASGVIETAGGESQAFKITRKQPDKYRYKVDFGDYSTETISNGRQAWLVSVAANGQEKVKELVGEALVQALSEGSMDGPFMKLAGRYDLIHPEAFEEVRGHISIRVAIDPSAGIPYHTIWLSSEHFQEVKLAFRSTSVDGAEPDEVEIYYTDFEQLLGIYHAKKIDYVVNGKPTQTMKIDRVRSNIGLFDSYFQKSGAF